MKITEKDGIKTFVFDAKETAKTPDTVILEYEKTGSPKSTIELLYDYNVQYVVMNLITAGYKVNATPKYLSYATTYVE